MFKDDSTQRIFALPPGVDFPSALVDGLIARSADQPPEELARVEVYVNTRRMQRRLKELFAQRGAFLLPRLRLITDLATDVALSDIPPAVPPLRRRLELTQLISHLLEQEPDLAPRAALFDLADSLAGLMDEMQGENVPPEKIAGLDISDQSGHWERALKFVTLVQQFFEADMQHAPDKEARQRLVVGRLIASWEKNPPQHPIIIAGSTGSRGTTHQLMLAAAQLPQGALILPGFDFDLPDHIWSRMEDALTSEDHPQYRFAKLLRGAGVEPRKVERWDNQPAPSPERNQLLSLALRPAPVTDQWMRDGKHLTDLPRAVENVTLLEAPSARAEAVAIALRLRQAAKTGETAALISPDRQLTRQVTAALDQWGIEPDDSAGRPLQLSAPGRFLRHISALFGQKLTSEALLTLLKHPLTNTGGSERGLHLLWTRELELKLRRHGPPFPDHESLLAWANARKSGDDGRVAWVTWICDLLGDLEFIAKRHLKEHLSDHIQIAETLSAGPTPDNGGELWEKQAGRTAKNSIDGLMQEADAGGVMGPADYNSLFLAVLGRAEVRDPTRPHPNIMIWGTLEARVQGADLMILGGLNDGTWPEQPTPDPWLNRQMRKDAGLLLPERRIGLSAHDFQQAAASPEVWITRSIRDAEAETVPSRWVNRLLNLMNGLKEQNGAALVKEMQTRGNYWLSLAEALETPEAAVAPERRPSPRPPSDQRPRQLSVTRIKTLIRDPYAIYAQYVLGLKPLDPIRQEPDAPLRGTILHSVLEDFIKEGGQTTDELMEIADTVLNDQAPWPATRRIWRSKLARAAEWFIAKEHERQTKGTPEAPEQMGHTPLDDMDFTLTAKADRFDRLKDGTVHIYDYKTGTPPSVKEQKYFDKQLLLEAAIVERGGFKHLGHPQVTGATYIGLGAQKEIDAPMGDPGIEKTWEELNSLIRAYFEPDKGYTSRRAVATVRFGGDYDHLARFGEWDETMDAVSEDVS
ncbi:double-strand break repair protein AddB [Cochlodiniinecator piscidefendens]|uniref:double-strand break repair protein AddB n=1 Tax=Cochlodiniinecator piscidefendens TaxID=2715756 RepID=UPI00140B12A3|nr:double-strand break repair protein AddB [Cochlodiniinecator piscidefendens]